MPKGGTAWVAIAKQLQLSQWDATKGGNYFIIKITYIEFMSNSRTQHLPPLSRQADSKFLHYFRGGVRRTGPKRIKNPQGNLRTDIYSFVIFGGGEW